MGDSLIYQGEWLNFYAVTQQAFDFILGLTDAEWNDFAVAATILEMSLRAGRPPGGRAERIEGSRVGLWELRITPPGRRGPQLRLLYVRRGRKIICVRGVVKRRRAIPRREIELAERAVRDWRRRDGGRS